MWAGLPGLFYSMEEETANPWMSTLKLDPNFDVLLHPLLLFEISDHIVRASQRGHEGAIVGALLGAQLSRSISIEFSFSCKTEKNKQGQWLIDLQWFDARLEQSMC